MAEQNENVRLTRREREREARRNEIMNAAAQVFAEKGYEHATLEEIAQRAEFGKGTIYHYFNSKEELFIEQVERAIDCVYNLAIQSAQLPNASSIDRLKHFAYLLVQFFKEHESLVRMLTIEHVRIMKFEKEVFKCLREKNYASIKVISGILEEGIKRKEVRPLDAEKAALIFFNMFRFMAFSNICEGKEILYREEVELILTMFFEGVIHPQNKKSGNDENSNS